VKFALIDAEKAEYPIAEMCEWLGVSRSGLYAWRARPESTHTVEDRRLAVLVRAAHERGRKTYGSPRVHAELVDDGEHVSRKRVARLMREQDLVARQRRRYKCTTMSDHDQPVAPNLLDRKFYAEAPNQRWVGDTTELLVGDSGAKLYLAVILDLFSRFVVGWAVSAVNDRHLTIKALDAALRRRCPGAGLLHHSDQGCTYASEDYQDILAQHGITCSMSRRGNCYDNAAMESWNSTLKTELGEHFESNRMAKHQLFDYIEVFYNQQRRHSSLGYVSPAECERVSHMATVA
jgi:putative transposase